MAQKIVTSLSPRGRSWRKRVQQWGRSGATQVQYCREHKFSVGTFRWWRRKLRDNPPARVPGKRSRPASVPTFTEIHIPHSGAATAAYAYERILPNRTQLRLRQNFEVQVVSALVSVLEASC